jgi:hypothetical protein
MDESNTIEPLGFFTLDALRAGWYLIWRQLVRIAIGAAVLGVLFGLLAALGFTVLATIILGLGAGAVTIWAIILIPRLTIQWAEQWYGATLSGPARIWWGVSWRVFVASLVAAVVCTPPNFVAMSLTTSFPGSALGLLGGVLTVLLAVVNFAVSILSTGWAMSKVAVGQIADGTAVVATFPGSTEAMAAAPIAAEPEPVDAAVEPAVPMATPAPVVVSVPVARPAPAPVVASVAAASVAPAPMAPTPRPAAATDKRQCPKCSLYETERGTVIGWYCKVCGWRESKAR